MKDHFISPDEIGLEYEDLYLVSGNNEKINAWYFPCNNSEIVGKKRVVLFCHGNAGNISHRIETIEYLLKFGIDVLVFDYRGFGKSEGSPDEESIYQDAVACYDWLLEQKFYKPEEIIIFGRSLGGAVAVDLGSKVLCGGLIVESSFTSAKAMAKEIFPLFPISLILKYNLDSVNKIRNIKCPVLITHSTDDEIIPYKMGEELYKTAPKPKKFVKLSGGHNNRAYFNDEKYRSALRELLFGDVSNW